MRKTLNQHYYTCSYFPLVKEAKRRLIAGKVGRANGSSTQQSVIKGIKGSLLSSVGYLGRNDGVSPLRTRPTMSGKEHKLNEFTALA